MTILELEKTSPSVRNAARLARNGVVVLTERGKPVCAVVGVKDELALEALALGRNRRFMSYLARVSGRCKRGQTHSLEDLRAEFGLPSRSRRNRKTGARRPRP